MINEQMYLLSLNRRSFGIEADLSRVESSGRVDDMSWGKDCTVRGPSRARVKVSSIISLYLFPIFVLGISLSRELDA
jgi:hypothetical protein